ncbi:MAG: hypothetical protein WAO98_05385 [Alphaproteobacteria bacterium]
MANNKYGLSRNIPEPIKKIIRQRCGFGCVICGNAIITYEHIEPTFAEAHSHDPEAMTLLCGDHQIQSSKGLLSKKSIWLANADPKCNQTGYANHMFDIGSVQPVVFLGGNDFVAPKIQFDGKTFLEILPPEEGSKRWRLSAEFLDSAGSVICKIKNNELLINTANYDIQQSTTNFVILGPDEILLDIEVMPPHSLLVKKYTHLAKNGKLILGRETMPDLLNPDVSRECAVLMVEYKNGSIGKFVNCSFVSHTGVNLNILNDRLEIGFPPEANC